MVEYTTYELKQINGGAGISGTMLNALIRGIGKIYEVGRGLGSAIRFVSAKKLCKI
ncbi:MAG: hypothetical protein ACK5HL_02800 [Bacilli bacterium]